MNILVIFGLVIYFIVFVFDFLNLFASSGKFLRSFVWSALWPLTMVFMFVGTIIAIFNASNGR